MFRLLVVNRSHAARLLPLMSVVSGLTPGRKEKKLAVAAVYSLQPAFPLLHTEDAGSLRPAAHLCFSSSSASDPGVFFFHYTYLPGLSPPTHLFWLYLRKICAEIRKTVTSGNSWKVYSLPAFV